jgi:predicted glutamine amidotransferase
MLAAICYVNPGGFGKAKALAHRAQPYYQLQYRQTPNGWIVASEPLDNNPHWKPMHHGQILIANAKGMRFQWL